MTNHADEDAAMAALFGTASRPPMGDEAFVGQVMARVEKEKAARSVRGQIVAPAIVAGAAAMIYPFSDFLGLMFKQTLVALTGSAPELNAGAATVLLALAAAGAAWAYTERN
jgi:hypothetical protein